MAEGGNVNQGEGSSIVKRELFPEEGSSVDVRKELSLLIKITTENIELNIETWTSTLDV